MSPRIGLVGARRVRQGLGPFVARHLCELGAEVVCVLGTTPETAARARDDLRADGIDARAWHELDAMLEAERLDALAILSPPESHARYLRAALASRLHALCEKPLVWGSAAPADEARELVRGFETAGLLLAENCQWPCTLDAYAALHPDALEPPVRRFEMRLSPASEGERMLVDSLSHPLSLLQALLPDSDARLESVGFEEPGPGALSVRFDWCAAGGRTACEVRLVRSESVPREAGYGVNGRWAERLVRKSDYSMLFADGDRTVDLPDPLRVLLAGFVGGLEGPASGVPASGTVAGTLIQRMRMLDSMIEAYRRAIA